MTTKHEYHKCLDGTYPTYDIMRYENEPWVMYPNRDMALPIKYCYECGAEL